MSNKSSGRSLKFGVLIVGMVVGAGLIIFDQQELIFGSLSVAQIPSLAILDIPIDTTGAILGTIKLGAPDVVPFEQSGTHISTISPTCTENFGRRLSNERNLDPIWWASQPISLGSISKHCAYAYAQWDLVDIPNEFVATSVQFQLEMVATTGQTSLNCLLTFNDFDIFTVGESALIKKLRSQAQLILEGRPSTFPNTPDFVQDPNGTWCSTLGVKSFNFGQTGVDFVNKAIGGGSFDQGTRTDKLVLGFVPSDLDRNDGFAQQYRISNQFWATQGSWLITGSSPPIDCALGFEQVGFRCVPLICMVGFAVNATNQCELIQCFQGEELQGNICVAIQCEIGEILVPPPLDSGINEFSCIPLNCPSDQQIIGDSCETLFCDVGFEAKNNVCSLIGCSTGMELVNDQCQAIQCAPNLILSGNNCIEKTCPANQFLVNNICQDEDSPAVTCGEGFNQIGNLCYQIQEELVCPQGTEKFENNCKQILPDLMISQAPELGTLTIVGIVVFAGSFFGLVGTTRRV